MQVDRLGEEHEAELAALRASIVEAVNSFAGGALSAEGLLDSLRGLGLEVGQRADPDVGQLWTIAVTRMCSAAVPGVPSPLGGAVLAVDRGQCAAAH